MDVSTYHGHSRGEMEVGEQVDEQADDAADKGADEGLANWLTRGFASR